MRRLTLASLRPQSWCWPLCWLGGMGLSGMGLSGMGLGATASAMASAPQPTAVTAPQDPVVGARRGLARIVYLHGGLAPGPELFAALRELGLRAVNVSSGASPEVPGKHGMGFYLDQPAGKGFLELRDDEWRGPSDAWHEQRDPAVLVRPQSLAPGADRTAARELLLERVREAAPLAPLGIAIADEPSVTKGTSPLDFDFGAPSLAGFREFLRERYGSIDALNSAWGSTWTGIDGVLPFTTERIRRRELQGDGFPADLVAWSDHRIYSDLEFAGAARALTDAARQAAQGVPAGLTGMQPPAAFGGYDYSLLVPWMDFYEAYDIGGARDLAMSMAAPGALRLETLAPPAEGESEGLVRARLADYVAHGAAAVVVWSSGELLREAAGGEVVPTRFGRQLQRAFVDLEGVADACAGARVLRDPVWIVESQASVRAWWMIDSAADGSTWNRRLTSYESTHSTSQAARLSWVRLFEDLGIQARLVPAESLPLHLNAQRPRLLVLPACLALSDASARSIQAYVAGGGTVVADHSPGLYDERLKLRRTPVLDEMFGVGGRTPSAADLLVREGRAEASARLASGGAAAERAVHGELGEPQGAFQVHLERRVGQGSAVYLNLAVCEYAGIRLEPAQIAAARDYRRRVRHVLRRAGVKPPADVRGEGLPTCLERLRLRTVDGRDLLVVRINALDNPALAGALGARGSIPIQLRLPFPRAVRDLRTGVAHASATEFELELDPFLGLFLEFTAGQGR